MTMITPSYLGETIEYSSLHACRSTLEDPTCQSAGNATVTGTSIIAQEIWSQAQSASCDISNPALSAQTAPSGAPRTTCGSNAPDAGTPTDGGGQSGDSGVVTPNDGGSVVPSGDDGGSIVPPTTGGGGDDGGPITSAADGGSGGNGFAGGPGSGSAGCACTTAPRTPAGGLGALGALFAVAMLTLRRRNRS